MPLYFMVENRGYEWYNQIINRDFKRYVYENLL